MSRFGKVASCLVLAAIFLFFGITVWPTRYRYDNIKMGEVDYPVRIDRLSGKTQILWGGGGWISSDASDNETKKENYHVLSNDIKKLDGHLIFNPNDGLIHAQIYNGTDRTISSITVEISIFRVESTPSSSVEPKKSATESKKGGYYEIDWEDLLPRPTDPKNSVGSDKIILTRKCQLTSTYGGSALAASEFTSNCGISLRQQQWYEWRILAADYKIY